MHRGKLGLILRDNNPNIAWPNTWAMPGGGQEVGELLTKTAKRELREELSIRPKVNPLGMTERGNGIFFCNLSDQIWRKVRLREGQRFAFFWPFEINKLELGGEFRTMFGAYPDQVKQMIASGQVPCPCTLGLVPWEGR